MFSGGLIKLFIKFDFIMFVVFIQIDRGMYVEKEDGCFLFQYNEN